jgi:hypothetical protein
LTGDRAIASAFPVVGDTVALKARTTVGENVATAAKLATVCVANFIVMLWKELLKQMTFDMRCAETFSNMIQAQQFVSKIE